MTRYLTLYTIFLVLLGCSDSLDCESVRLGKYFISTDYIGDIIIERTDSVFTESTPKNNKSTISRISWINECEFVLSKPISSTNEIPNLDLNETIHCQIIRIESSYHVVKCDFEDGSIVEYKLTPVLN